MPMSACAMAAVVHGATCMACGTCATSADSLHMGSLIPPTASVLVVSNRHSHTAPFPGLRKTSKRLFKLQGVTDDTAGQNSSL
jgi:hypothetical protein